MVYLTATQSYNRRYSFGFQLGDSVEQVLALKRFNKMQIKTAFFCVVWKILSNRRESPDVFHCNDQCRCCLFRMMMISMCGCALAGLLVSGCMGMIERLLAKMSLSSPTSPRPKILRNMKTSDSVVVSDMIGQTSNNLSH